MTGWLVKCSVCGFRVSTWNMYRDVNGIQQAICFDCKDEPQDAA